MLQLALLLMALLVPGDSSAVRTEYRLPTTLVPETYTLKLAPYPDEGTFVASVSITLTVAQATDTIVLHSDGLLYKQTDVKVTDQGSGASVTVERLIPDAIHDFMSIVLSTSLTEGEEYELSIAYNGSFTSDFSGLFLGEQETSDGSAPIIMTHLVPTNARRMFPCFDEPGFRANITVSLAVAQNDTQIALSSGNFVSTSSADSSIEDRVWQTFTTWKIPTYSFAIAITTSVSYVGTNDNNLEIAIFGSSTFIDGTSAAEEDITMLLTFYTNLTQKVPDLEQLSFLGASSHLYDGTTDWALDIMRQDTLAVLDGYATSSALNEKNVHTNLAHVVAEYWFGNTISFEWWDSTWLSAGFATYFQFYGADAIRPDLGLFPMFATDVLIPAFVADAFESAHALNYADILGSTESIKGSLDLITRQKGAGVVSTIHHILGDDGFRTGLSQFLADRAYLSSTPDHLYASLSTAIANDTLPEGATLAQVLSTWVDLKGYPVVTVKKSVDGEGYTLTQERFLIHTPSSGVTVTGLWYIPVSVTTQSLVTLNRVTAIQQTGYWIEPNAEFSGFSGDDSTWYLINGDRTAFYRVNYDDANWILLGKALKTESSAIQMDSVGLLVDDALALARTGRLDYDTALQFVDFLRAEKRVVPWQIARLAFSFLNSVLLETDYSDIYKLWQQQLLAAAEASLGFDLKDSDTFTTKLARAAVTAWACEAGLTSCTQSAAPVFTKWLESSTSVISHDTLSAVVCTGAKSATDAKFNTAISNLKNEKSAPNRASIIEGLGCTSKSAQRQQLLGLTIKDSGLYPDDVSSIYQSVSRFGPSSVSLALCFLQENLKSSVSQCGSSGVAAILVILADRVSNQTQYDTLSSLVRSVDSSSETLQSSLLLAKDNLAWQGKYLQAVGATLETLTDSTTSTVAPTTAKPSGNSASATACSWVWTLLLGIVGLAL